MVVAAVVADVDPAVAEASKPKVQNRKGKPAVVSLFFALKPHSDLMEKESCLFAWTAEINSAHFIEINELDSILDARLVNFEQFDVVTGTLSLVLPPADNR